MFDKKYKMKLLTAVIAIACTMNPPASCFAKAGAVGGAATDVIQEEVNLVVINSSGVSSKQRIKSALVNNSQAFIPS